MAIVNCLRCRFWHADNGNCTAVGGVCTAVPAGHCPLLREYLDTELTPEKVSTLVKDWSDLCTIIGECGGLTRVKALTEADKDGRLAVHGRWISFLDGDHIMPERYYRCSRCGRVESRRQPYCHCGAKMDGGDNTER
jgi:hypothetical protein